ncbi:folate-binding protein YgfZ [Rhizobium sp. S153]|uniref:Folate-binding protein YgfZ n=1 Tax=Ciceribacter sichuanensis TaxID=2949647 RepID=A0ABT0V3A6_9HYPH|nr:folate-binding protein YgfZ [Ciceribacter sp. S153]MCM2400276.1 folate-binding protein YgfZ [Ciceribacter sp. S153]
MPAAFLQDRSLIRVSGADAEHFLQNLITTDIEAMPVGEARPGALLTPQGKILFDFLIWRDGQAFVLETASSQLEGLIKRLSMYKLRAAVTIAAEAQSGVTVSWGEDIASEGVSDFRFARADVALKRQPGEHGAHNAAGYDALRVLSGVVESGRDYALQDAFPHDILLDLSGGVSFKKGCYVGQEVVSRMQHRGTARRRVVIVTAEENLPPTGTELTAQGKPIGTLGTVTGNRGLAIVRIDRAGEAISTDAGILAADVPVALALPTWSGLSFPTSASEEA